MTTNIFADIVLTNGFIYTADEHDTIVEAVAIKGEKIIYVGSTQQALNYINKQTYHIDLQGKMVIPGMIDTHIHPPGLSLSELYEVQLTDCNSMGEYLAAVRAFISHHPDANMIYGRGWSWGILTGEELIKGPRKEYLDSITTDIPVVLRAHDGHTLWLNSKALEMNGVNQATIAPSGGVIEKDSAGELWGTLKEWAMHLITLPEYSLTQYLDAMTAFQNKMHSYGITGVLVMGSFTFPAIFKACAELQNKELLQLRVRGAMTINAKDDLDTQLAAITELRAQYITQDLQVTAAKFFTDGVVEGGTSFLLTPYSPEAGKGTNYYGEFLWDIDKLKHAFYMANRSGLQIHVHSTGDASTQNVLNALEAIQLQLPEEDYRNTITHLQLVASEDILRFKSLRIIASVQPYWHFKGPDWWTNVDYRFLGDRAELEFPLASFFTNGITVISSSDYPATIIPNPLLAIDTGVTRNMAQGSLQGLADIVDADDKRYLLNADERSTLLPMIKSFTINGAYALLMEKQIGSIEIGKLADIVVLDQNLLTINPIDIDKAKVVMTFFNGKLVYERSV